MISVSLKRASQPLRIESTSLLSEHKSKKYETKASGDRTLFFPTAGRGKVPRLHQGLYTRPAPCASAWWSFRNWKPVRSELQLKVKGFLHCTRTYELENLWKLANSSHRSCLSLERQAMPHIYVCICILSNVDTSRIVFVIGKASHAAYICMYMYTSECRHVQDHLKLKTVTNSWRFGHVCSFRFVDNESEPGYTGLDNTN